jgi:hypothetical protein
LGLVKVLQIKYDRFKVLPLCKHPSALVFTF